MAILLKSYSDQPIFFVRDFDELKISLNVRYHPRTAQLFLISITLLDDHAFCILPPTHMYSNFFCFQELYNNISLLRSPIFAWQGRRKPL